MDQIARELCSGYIDEAWRTGFAAGCATTIFAVIAIHLLMKLSTWMSERRRNDG